MNSKRRRFDEEGQDEFQEDEMVEDNDLEYEEDEDITLGTFDFSGTLDKQDAMLKKLSQQEISISGSKGDDDEEMEEDDGEDDDDDEEDEGNSQNVVKPFVPKKKEEYKMEELDFSNDAYTCLHRFLAPWPIPSFSFIYTDSDSGTFPYKMFVVSGNQIADEHGNIPLVKGSKIKQKHLIHVWNLFNMYNTQYDSDDDENNQVPLKEKDIPPAFEIEEIYHKRPFSDQNRVRIMPTGNLNSTINNQVIVALYCDSGHVQIIDISRALQLVSNRTIIPKLNEETSQILYTSPFVSEGWALDWSKVKLGRLASGGQDKIIRVYDFDPITKKTIEVCSLSGHKASVEDIQWSPSEPQVLASASCDGTIRVWDIGSKSQQLVWKASTSDVNVISWNPNDQTQIASGDDTGIIRVWNIQEIYKTALQRKNQYIDNPRPSEHFDFHKYAITSVEWHPTDPSTLLVTSEDDTCTIWDFGLEAEEEVQEDIPPQLLFVHMGLSNIKEAHWHPKVENTVVVCGENALHVFRPSNL